VLSYRYNIPSAIEDFPKGIQEKRSNIQEGRKTGILTNAHSIGGIEEDVVHGEGSHGLQERIVDFDS